MRYLALVQFLLGVLATEVFGQSNQPPMRALYLVPHMQLRDARSEPKKPLSSAPVGQLEIPLEEVSASLKTPRVGEADIRAERSTLDISHRDFDFQVFHRLDQEGYFDRPPAPPDNAVARWAQNAFTPEILHIGKTTVSCSLLTAIKRKNPLWLLDPYFLQVSW